MKRNYMVRCAAGIIFFLAFAVQPAEPFSLVIEGDVPERLDVPYVPTPDEIVEAMIRMAGITERDVVYDLGCGDGRIIITACSKTGARGVGVDIDPERIAESRRNAREAKVEDKVTFIQQDFFKTDFSEATVLALYLLPEINVKLRPRVLNELKPGTRIVSHNYSMGDWLPDIVRHIDSRHSVYVWTVPANIGGTWDCRMKERDGTKRHILRLDQGYQVVTGDISTSGGRIRLSDVRLLGDELRFTVDRKTANGSIPVNFKARAKGNLFEGTFESPGDKTLRGSWSAKRDPSSVKPLEGSGNKVIKTLRVLK